MKLRVVFAAVVLVAFAATFAATESSGARISPPRGLSSAGRALWNFEALLQDVFHTKNVIEKGVSLDFELCANNCVSLPLSAYAIYTPVFADAASSAYHLSNKPVHDGEFGNYPQLIRVAGHPVACNARETTFLITYADDVGLSLSCQRPVP